MERATPLRGDFLPKQHPRVPPGPLLPSIMPPPSSTVKPTASTTKPYPVPPALRKTRLDTLVKEGNQDVVRQWRKDVSIHATHDGTRSSRHVLGPLHANTFQTEASTSQPRHLARDIKQPVASTSTFKQSFTKSTFQRTSLSIPKPPTQPDVFLDQSQPLRPLLHNDKAGHKRLRGSSQDILAVKRAKTEAAKQQHRLEEEHWQTKWIKVFPTLVFYFDADVDEATIRNLRTRVIKMGAKVEQFFSQKVSHLIVKTTGSPIKLRAPGLVRGGERLQESPMNPFVALSGLAITAEDMGMKVWGVRKLSDMLARVAPPIETPAMNNTLLNLLEDERIHGTRERDLTAPRPGYRYFKSSDKYLLIEDVMGKHRPIMIKEYGPAGKDGAEWPVPYENFLRISASAQTNIPVDRLRERAMALFVHRIPFEGEQPPGAVRPAANLSQFEGTPKCTEVRPYQQASGNSVVITSNIASTSTAHPSPFATGVPGIGAMKDRAIMQMSKRVQVLKGNARLMAQKRVQPDDIFAIPAPKASGMTLQPKAFITHEQLLKLLDQTNEPVKEEYVSREMRMANRQKVDAQYGTKEQDTAPGYCENCRLRYSDLSVHLYSKKHRRFAANDDNFKQLDAFLEQVIRPCNPHFIELEHPPCLAQHYKDDGCEACREETSFQDEVAMPHAIEAFSDLDEDRMSRDCDDGLSAVLMEEEGCSSDGSIEASEEE